MKYPADAEYYRTFSYDNGTPRNPGCYWVWCPSLGKAYWQSIEDPEDSSQSTRTMRDIPWMLVRVDLTLMMPEGL